MAIGEAYIVRWAIEDDIKLRAFKYEDQACKFVDRLKEAYHTLGIAWNDKINVTSLEIE